MAAPAGAQPGDLTDPNLIIRKYQIMQQECQALAGKVCLAYAMQCRVYALVGRDLVRLNQGTPSTHMQLQELEMELGEHELVVKQLTPLDGGRRAFRLANGVLMERTVGEVLPELTNTAENVRACAIGWLI